MVEVPGTPIDPSSLPRVVGRYQVDRQRVSRSELELAAARAQRDAIARWLGGWGVFLMIAGTLGGCVLIIAGLATRNVSWLAGGLVTLFAAFFTRAWCDWGCQLLLTLGRMEDDYER